MELVIVLILIGLSVALVTPSLSGLSRSIELQAAAKRISALLRSCRSEAVYKGMAIQVSFDAARGAVMARPVEEAGEEHEGQREVKIPLKKFSLPEGVRIREVNAGALQFPSDLPALEFYPHGGSSGGSILLGRDGHRDYRVRVHFLTGMVKVEGG